MFKTIFLKPLTSLVCTDVVYVGKKLLMFVLNVH